MPELTMEEFWSKLLNIYSVKMGELMKDPDEWKNFLKASSFYYKMRFDQQVMIFAQKPNAKVIAMSDQWYKLYRPVKKKTQAIYVFKNENHEQKRYLRYYEPSSTNLTDNSKRIPVWNMKSEYQTFIAEALKDSFEDVTDELKIIDKSSFENILLSATEIAVKDNIEKHYATLLSDTEFSELDGMEKDDILRIFDKVVVNSVGYAILSRLGINTDQYINPIVFNDIQKFNTEEVLSAVGNATQKISQNVLTIIAKTVKEYENTYNKEEHDYDYRPQRIDARRISRIQENDTQRENRVQQVFVGGERLPVSGPRRNDTGNSAEILQQEQRSVVSAERGGNLRPDDRATEGRGTVGRDIRSQTEGLPREQEVSEIRQNDVLRRTEPSLQSAPRGMQGDGGTTLQGNGTNRGIDRGTERTGSDGLGTNIQQDSEQRAGDNSQRQSLHLTDNPIRHQAEYEENSNSAFHFSDTETSPLERIYAEDKNLSLDKFFLYEECERINWMYFNPDGNDGNGQFVTVEIRFENIIEAQEKTDTVDSFFDYFNTVCKTNLSDVGTIWYEEAYSEFNELPTFIGCTDETMNALISVVNRDKNIEIIKNREIKETFIDNFSNNRVLSEENEEHSQDEIHNIAVTFSANEELLREIINLNPNEHSLNAFGRFNKFLDTVDKAKAREFFEKEENSKLSPIKVNAKLNKFLRDFILNYEPVQKASNPQEFADQNMAKHGEISVTKTQLTNFDLSTHEAEKAGKKERYQRNIEAIKILKNCDSEGHLATHEEQIKLSEYVGWGGLQEAFDPNNTAWKKEYTELKSLLTENEYNNATESTLTAFYTPQVVIKAIYKALDRFGFEEGNILEPSCGIGNFIGMLPPSMKDSKIYGVEMENISAGIAHQLYQTASISAKPFEKAHFPDNFFDVVVGNVPFNNIKVIDTRYNKYKFFVHDYFFAKSLDKMRPGGIAALITSQGTLDRKNPSVRKYISQRAELIGAIRLPNDTFGGNAGADRVTSDIIFLQKRERMCEIEADWVHLDFDENGIEMNSYFVQHPEMILGEMKMVSGPFGPKSTCVPIEGTELEAMLERAVNQLTAQITDYEVEFEEELNTIPADPTVRNNSYTVINGMLYYRTDSVMEERTFSEMKRKGSAENRIERIKAMLPIRDCTRHLIEMQSDDYPDELIAQEQKHLNSLYDNFTAKYGYLNDRENIRAFAEDSASALLSSLEIIDGEGKIKGKSAIFTKRTILPHTVVSKVDSAREALAVSLSEKAVIDIDYMMKLTDKTENELYSELQGEIYLNPIYNESHIGYNGKTEQKYIPSDEYLSGNVRQKLSIAKIYAEKDSRFNVNVTSLEKVQPKDLTPSEISVSLGSTWIPAKYYTDFAYEVFKIPAWAKVDVIYSPYTGTWKVEGKKSVSTTNTTVVFGTKRINGLEILERTLNLRSIKINDIEYVDGKSISVPNDKETELANDKKEDLQLEFEQWIWKDTDRRRDLVAIYNENFNSIVARHYDGSKLSFPGMNPEIDLYAHQKNAVARIIYGGNSLLAHCVGAGKTFTMITASQELKRLGLCNKSLIVVPNHLLKQWGNEYMRLYPGGNILVSTPNDFSEKGRKRFTAKIATGDYDAIIITQSQFSKLQLSPELRQQYLQEEVEKVDDLMLEASDRYTVKQLEIAKKNLKNRLDLLLAEEKKDDMIYFDELGIDRLFVDEAHAYKNLYHVSKMSNVSGLATRESQRATNMHFICRYLDETTYGKGVIFATGTPLANSLSEVYTIMSNLQIGLLKETNMTLFDKWASTFARSVTEFELATEGNSLIEKTRFSQFLNVPELRIMVDEVMDVQTANMLKLKVPRVIRKTELNPRSEIQEMIMESFAERAESYRQKKKGYRKQEMLLIANDGKKMSLDQRVYDPDLPPADDSKVDRCVKNVYDLYLKFDNIKGTQMVFCDLSVPNAKNKNSFCIYDELKQKLIEKGIPESEIKYIHEANSDEKKEKLFKKVRTGEVRVLIGSTEMMGTGTNAQDRLIGLHHLTCPWRPIDLEQREGRIIRQGNMNEEVYIFTYVTEGTFDANMYQTVARKQRVASQFLSEDPPRTCEDIDEVTLTYYDIAAITTGNPLMKEQAELQKEIAKLQRQKITYDNQQYTLQDKIDIELPKQIENERRALDVLTLDSNIALANPRGEEFCGITVENKFFNDRKEGGEALQAILKTKIVDRSTAIGAYRGFELRMAYDPKHKAHIVSLKANHEYKLTYSSSSTGLITKLDNQIEKIKEKLSDTKNKLDGYIAELAEAKETVKKEFPYADELAQKKSRFDEINIELSKDNSKNITTKPMIG